MKRKRKGAKRRNVFAASLSRFRRRIEPSAKLYTRKAKHRKAPDHSSGGFSNAWFANGCGCQANRA